MPNLYYTNSSGNYSWETLSNWNTAPDGSGSTPTEIPWTGNATKGYDLVNASGQEVYLSSTLSTSVTGVCNSNMYVINYGNIRSGTFNSFIQNVYGSIISGGTFNGIVGNDSGDPSNIIGGTFNSYVYGNYSIGSNPIFSSSSSIDFWYGSVIAGGTFNCNINAYYTTVYNGQFNGFTTYFNSDGYHELPISGGTFNGTNLGISGYAITGGNFSNVTNFGIANSIITGGTGPSNSYSTTTLYYNGNTNSNWETLSNWGNNSIGFPSTITVTEIPWTKTDGSTTNKNLSVTSCLENDYFNGYYLAISSPTTTISPTGTINKTCNIYIQENYGKINSGTFTAIANNRGIINGGTISCQWNYGTINSGTISLEYNNGEINGGNITITGYITYSTVNGGTINGNFDVYCSSINGGTFLGDVNLYSQVSYGIFNGNVNIGWDGGDCSAYIDDGIFNGNVYNSARINGGTFNGDVENFLSFVDYYNNWSGINAGTFNGSVLNHGLIDNGTFNGNVESNVYNPNAFENSPTITNGTFNGDVYNNGDFGAVYVTGGTFNGDYSNSGGYTSGGSFYGASIYNNGGGLWSGGTVYGNSFINDYGYISNGIFLGNNFYCNGDYSTTIGGGIFSNINFYYNGGYISGGNFSTVENFQNNGPVGGITGGVRPSNSVPTNDIYFLYNDNWSGINNWFRPYNTGFPMVLTEVPWTGTDGTTSNCNLYGGNELGPYIDVNIGYRTNITGECYIPIYNNYATIYDGTFHYSLGYNDGNIFGGTFYDTNNNGLVVGWYDGAQIGSITGGDFYVDIILDYGDIIGGNFYRTLTMGVFPYPGQTFIYGGNFYGNIIQNNYNTSSIEGGNFYAGVTSYSYINGGNFGKVTYLNNYSDIIGGIIAVDTYSDQGGTVNCPGIFAVYNEGIPYTGSFAGCNFKNGIQKYGCLNRYACNYDITVSEDDGSCYFKCQDPTALNYNTDCMVCRYRADKIITDNNRTIYLVDGNSQTLSAYAPFSLTINPFVRDLSNKVYKVSYDFGDGSSFDQVIDLIKGSPLSFPQTHQYYLTGNETNTFEINVNFHYFNTNSISNYKVYLTLQAPELNKQFVPTDYLAFWTFDNGPFDSSGNGYDLTTNNSVGYNAGVFGNAAYFGYEAYFYNNEIQIKPSSDFTICGWIQMFDSENIYPVMNTGNFSITYGEEYQSLGFIINTKILGVQRISIYVDNPYDWNFFVMRWIDGSRLEAKINNGPWQILNISDNLVANGGTDLVIGADVNIGYYLNGALDQIGIWERTLSDAEIDYFNTNGDLYYYTVDSEVHLVGSRMFGPNDDILYFFERLNPNYILPVLVNWDKKSNPVAEITIPPEYRPFELLAPFENEMVTSIDNGSHVYSAPDGIGYYLPDSVNVSEIHNL